MRLYGYQGIKFEQYKRTYTYRKHRHTYSGRKEQTLKLFVERMFRERSEGVNRNERLYSLFIFSFIKIAKI